MPFELFAACASDNGLIVNRVVLHPDVAPAVQKIFRVQEEGFFLGVEEEIEFEGSFKPDEDQILSMLMPPEFQPLVDASQENGLSLQQIKAENFEQSGIKALFSITTTAGKKRILIQRFTNRQMISRQFVMMQKGSTFNRMTETAFTFDSSLTAVIENGQLKFKHFSNVANIVNMMSYYREATDQEVLGFANVAALSVANPERLLKMTNSVSRKLIRAVMDSKILDTLTPTAIQEIAAKTKYEIKLEDGKIVVPGKHSELKTLLRFLNEDRFSGLLTGTSFEANSKKRA